MDDYVPYEEEGWKRRFEMTIPLLLLVLVIIVLAWKLQWLCAIPGLGSIACGNVVNVLIVGDDADIAKSLDEMRVGMPVNYEVYRASDIKGLRDPDYIKKYDLVILTESIGTNPSDLPSLFREYLVGYLSGGGKMIMFGVAGATDPANPSVDGWRQAGLDAFVPVTCKYQNSAICDVERSRDNSSANIVTLKSRETDNPLIREFGTSIKFQNIQELSYMMVNIDSGAKELLTLEIERQIDQPDALPALVEKSTVAGTPQVVYFAYHPALTQTIFKNTINYIMGRL